MPLKATEEPSPTTRNVLRNEAQVQPIQAPPEAPPNPPLNLLKEKLEEASQMSPTKMIVEWHKLLRSELKMEAQANRIIEAAQSTSFPATNHFSGVAAPNPGQPVTRQIIRDAKGIGKPDSKPSFARRRFQSADASLDFRWWAVMLSAVVVYATGGELSQEKYLDKDTYTEELLKEVWDGAARALVIKIIAVQNNTTPQSIERRSDTTGITDAVSYQLLTEEFFQKSPNTRLSSTKARKRRAFSVSHLCLFVEKVHLFANSPQHTAALEQRLDQRLDELVEDSERAEGDILYQQLEELSQHFVSTPGFGSTAVRSRARTILSQMACLVSGEASIRPRDLEAMVSLR